MHVALSRLAEQDPLINLRQDDTRRELFVSLYGEVQKEVIQATLAADFGVDVEFRESTTICIERPVGTGAAVEVMGKRPNPFRATVGLRIAPAPAGSGAAFRLAGEVHGTMPLAFFTAVEDTVQQTLRQGLCGWQVADCAVVMTRSGYSSVMSTAGDFRKLTPLVLMAALQQAGTRVHEPLHRFRLELPADTLGAVVPLLARLGAARRRRKRRGRPACWRGRCRRPGRTSCSSACRRSPAARACWSAPSTATGPSPGRSPPAPGRTTTPSTARRTCCTSTGASKPKPR